MSNAQQKEEDKVTEKENAHSTPAPMHGEDTIAALDNAGIFRREKSQRQSRRIAALVGAIVALAITLDLTGVWTIPGLGGVYSAIGIPRPETEQSVEPAAPARKSAGGEAMRRKLLGLEQAGTQKLGTGHLTQAQRQLAASLYSDERKTAGAITLKPPKSVQVPSLPEGLTSAAILQVIQENSRSMGLCVARAARAGEKLGGKMESELTIDATGKVRDAKVIDPAMRKSQMGQCAVTTFKRWRFPAFSGDSVTVSVPYVLSASL